MRLILAVCVLATLVSACGRRTPELSPHETQAAAQVVPTYPVQQFTTYPTFGDADPHEWDGRRPTSYPIHGIDISRWQGEIDWATAKQSGVSFAFIKATEGGDVADPKFDTHRIGAQRAGVPWGAYHYYYFCRTPQEQARWFIQHVPKGGELPHVLDMEWNPRSRTCKRRPSGKEVMAEARTFLNILEAHYGRRPVVYTTVDFYRDTGIGRLSGTELWLRSVAGHPIHVYPGAYWTFWQYTGTGLVPGIDGKVDINVFRGTPEGFGQWIARR
ncbi:MAG: GH25 family lysozyme [Tateyamaria sp.]|uniref:glycoside hydrolase family 25 protein n=1 Tax=Roseobacteraceae TaxID=2854170 RepID=UPI003299B9CE